MSGLSIAKIQFDRTYTITRSFHHGHYSAYRVDTSYFLLHCDVCCAGLEITIYYCVNATITPKGIIMKPGKHRPNRSYPTHQPSRSRQIYQSAVVDKPTPQLFLEIAFSGILIAAVGWFFAVAYDVDHPQKAEQVGGTVYLDGKPISGPQVIELNRQQYDALPEPAPRHSAAKRSHAEVVHAAAAASGCDMHKASQDLLYWYGNTETLDDKLARAQVADLPR